MKILCFAGLIDEHPMICFLSIIFVGIVLSIQSTLSLGTIYFILGLRFKLKATLSSWYEHNFTSQSFCFLLHLFSTSKCSFSINFRSTTSALTDVFLLKLFHTGFYSAFISKQPAPIPEFSQVISKMYEP